MDFLELDIRLRSLYQITFNLRGIPWRLIITTSNVCSSRLITSLGGAGASGFSINLGCIVRNGNSIDRDGVLSSKPKKKN
jgi:hypothetical protein